MCLSNNGWEDVRPVSQNPLTYLVRLREGSANGLERRAELFAEMFEELREKNPGRAFQLFPFSYDNLGRLESVLAVSDQGEK